MSLIGLHSRFLALPLTLLVSCLAASAPAAQAQTAPPAPVMASIEGTVLRAATGEPLKRARLTLRRVEGRSQPLIAITDAAGRFSFPQLAPGQYRLSADRNGYVRQEYGQRGSSGGVVITLAAGQTLRDIRFRLLNAAVIAGQVRDEDGEPVAGATVQVLRQSYRRGRRALMPAGNATTNDLGEYRLHSLAPGRYLLLAQVSRWLQPGEFVSRPDDNEGDQSYLPLYYPGVTDPARALPLDLQSGQELQRMDFSFVPVPSVRVRGRVFNSVTGQPGHGATVSLTSRDFSQGNPARNRADTDEQGNFELRGVAPGSYVLAALWSQSGRLYAAREFVEVGAADVDGATLVITSGADLSGKVRFEVAPTSSSGLRVFLQPRDDDIAGGAATSVQADGSFAFRNLFPDAYRVTVSGLPEDLYVKAVRLGAEDVLDSGLSLARGSGGTLEIVVGADGGRVEGVLSDVDSGGLGMPASGATIVLVPEPRRRDRPDLYQSATSDPLGRFVLRGVAPGEYKLFAWDDVEPGAWQDPEYLRPFEERGKAVRVEAASRQSVELKLIRLP